MESHQAALWIGDMEAVTDSLCYSESLIFAEAQLAETSLFAAKPSSCLGQVVEAIVYHSFHCLDNTGCEAGRR